MPRDDNLKIKILKYIDDNPSVNSSDINLEGYSSHQINLELELLVEEYLINGIDVSDKDGTEWIKLKLTADGYQYLNDVLSKKIEDGSNNNMKKKIEGALELIKDRIEKLEDIVRNIPSRNLGLGFEKIKRWREETAKAIIIKINSSESEKFDRVQYPTYVDKKRTLMSEYMAYRNFLLVLQDTIKSNPDILFAESRETTQDNSEIKKMFQQEYVNIERIRELRSIKSTSFDYSKLIKLCEELNHAYQNECFHSMICLTRNIIDHVPPIFGFTNFREIVNNYKNGTTFKSLMKKLEETSRDIANINLHTPIKRKVALPNKTQIDFKQELDMLLGKIIELSS